MVHGRYAIYANNDYLSVDGSKHHLVVVIDALDRTLEKAGWEQTAAEGDFVICSERLASPQQLTRQDAVRVKGYSHIRLSGDAKSSLTANRRWHERLES